MALSSLNKDVATRLFRMLSAHDDSVSIVKQNYAAYGKLSIIAAQMQMLEAQAKDIMDESLLNHRLSLIPTPFAKVPGTTYHWYTQGEKDVLSIVSPSEWSQYERHNGSFLYDFDLSFRRR